jgi:DNA-binding NarL/FixJ family response regulator
LKQEYLPGGWGETKSEANVRLREELDVERFVTYADAGFAPREHDLYAAFLLKNGVERHPITAGAARYYGAPQCPGRLVVRTRRQLVADRAWYESVAYNECHRAIGIDHFLTSVLEQRAAGWFHCILLHRAAGERDFAPRHRHLLRIFHEELGRLIGTVLLSARNPCSPNRLPPRVRETLSCLLEGEGEKQAAARMGVSRETVHQYVKSLYRHYGVASRAELLARVLRRTWNWWSKRSPSKTSRSARPAGTTFRSAWAEGIRR